ncbi:hypothetical protein KAH43_00345 [Candidatus Bipolaricaulota bacterium]|nr:hypothetical protein [Candidatus Bipolaricaulota bacterium]
MRRTTTANRYEEKEEEKGEYRDPAFPRKAVRLFVLLMFEALSLIRRVFFTPLHVLHGDCLLGFYL